MAASPRVDRTSTLALAGAVLVALSVAVGAVLAFGGGDGRAPLVSLLIGSGLVAGLALVLAAPLGLIAAIHVVEFAGQRERRLIESVFAALAVVPSVVWVYIAISVAPEAEPSALLAATILACAATPTVALGCIAALDAVPIELREGAWALGAGRAQAVLTIVIPSAGRGLGAAILLGLIRVLGELVIVAVLSGSELATLDLGAPAETLAGFVAHVAAAGPTAADEASVVLVAAWLTGLVAVLGLARHGLMARRSR